jgi:ATP-dependent Lon protease
MIFRKDSRMNSPQGRLPVLTLKNVVVFPGLTQVVRVGRERSVNALKQAEKKGFWILAVQQKNRIENKDQSVEPKDLYQTGTICRIESMRGSPENGYQVVLRGFDRAQLEDVVITETDYIECEARKRDDVLDMNDPTRTAMMESLKSLSKNLLKLVPANTDQIVELINSVEDLSYLTSLAAGNLDIDVHQKQRLLEMFNLRERVLLLLTFMQEFKQGLEVQNEIRGKLNQKLGDAHRQSILREQLKAIREELGEGDQQTQEEKLYDKLEQAGMPGEVKKIADNELKRLKEIGPQSPESHIIRNYIDLLAALPWSKSAVDKEIDLTEARRILDEDHYGLEKIKNRIVQHLAVLKLKKDLRGSILLFVGPPGVGKTSLGQSIAKVLSKKFARVSFGGVRDDAEVRGHRRTYIGAMPGRIIQGIKKAGENNPVFLLDEIDKLARSYNGDPAAALLEVLDPEQNATFLDHYLDVPYDLSKVFFIATANSLEGIPGPLLDRMEVIEVHGYTTAEKIHIAKNHLWPKQVQEFGVTPEQVQIEDTALMRIICHYTREAGVRELKRQLANLLRGVSEKIVVSKDLVKIGFSDIEEILGAEKYIQEVTESKMPEGVVTGLAWTPVGGDILFVEATKMPGKGKLIITGQLGDVMKESARIALSYLMSHAPTGPGSINLNNTDLHVHVPAGAIPKDGPSAGVTLLTSLFSLALNKPVDPRLAMTGEITLRGSVMPVGGIKEKIIAAHRAGVNRVILSERNRKDIKEIPEEVRSHIKFEFVNTMAEVLKVALDYEITDQSPLSKNSSWTQPPQIS